MGLEAGVLRVFFLLDVGGAQVLATGKTPGPEIDFKYALIGTALGVVIVACFLALKICMIKKHLFDNESSDQKSINQGLKDFTTLKEPHDKKRASRLNLNHSESSLPFQRGTSDRALSERLLQDRLCSLDKCSWLQSWGYLEFEPPSW
ncbi:transmembrane protein 273 isoform X2 [Talpa occidentalis]|uniref:transmembrane protein 273 isoform X2 n=1 Tax=Talpa occidentalis TaxID=50954 RepID=UPI0023F9D405|nr:transmembrane protein 273 isoform X2 [Talpa occidentalis]